jgi:hypothetical protein
MWTFLEWIWRSTTLCVYALFRPEVRRSMPPTVAPLCPLYDFSSLGPPFWLSDLSSVISAGLLLTPFDTAHSFLFHDDRSSLSPPPPFLSSPSPPQMVSLCLAFGVFHVGPECRFSYHNPLPETEGFKPGVPPLAVLITGILPR